MNLAAARLWALTQAPYLASALFALRAVEHEASAVASRHVHDDGEATVTADANWNVHVTGDLPAEQAGWWLLHHVSHLLRDHHARARDGAWNLAADAEVNDDLPEAPFPAVSPETLGLPAGLLAEQYLPLLDLIDPVEDLVACPAPPYTAAGALSDVERTLLVRAVAAEIEAARAGVPGGWRRWAEEVLRPSVDWRALLAALVRHGLARSGGRLDHSYRRPSRRQLPDVVLPSMVRPLPRVAVIADTSGSVREPELRRVLGEVDGVLRAGAAHVDVICCDAAAHPPQRVRRAAEVNLIGGGGTDMRAGLAAAGALRPDLAVVLTDGQTPWPERRPRYPVVVCLYAPASAPSWAHVVRVAA
ncbi:VWA-like domain-containing protein [Nonomuraea typhae]|uniref:VWA-like domain-containing protein n=1 Tax=Nonomuraea typhae TaxID=2603600 RepID=A0ABW7YM33_9ACTN